ncbi:hypothetical protein SSX86_024796 [Deinandra increscens subsp. villosa]|uniref:Uncharacterized protein n=1 Tax=Deinandra increscens subsp. villosa TaxID=3103831 RepID=A0AAP0CHC4_9ASTR
MSASRRRVQLEGIPSDTSDYDDEKPDLGAEEGSDDPTPSDGNLTEYHDPFAGGKVRRKASMARVFKGDYIDVRSKPYLMRILEKRGKSIRSFREIEVSL